MNVFEAIKKGDEISSTTKTVIDSRKPQPRYNDTNNIKQNSMNYVLYEGKVSITFEWTDDDGITEDDLNVYQKYLEDQSKKNKLRSIELDSLLD